MPASVPTVLSLEWGRGSADTLNSRALMQKNWRNLKVIPTETSWCPRGVSAYLRARGISTEQELAG